MIYNSVTNLHFGNFRRKSTFRDQWKTVEIFLQKALEVTWS